MPRIIRFIKCQVKGIRSGGLPALARKGRKFLIIVLTLPIILPILLVVRMLRPVIVIRFGKLRSDRIGHFASNTEVYLCEHDAGMHGERILDIFCHTKPVCNRQLKKMWDRVLCVTSLAYPLDIVNRWLPGSEKHMIPWREVGHRDIYGLLEHTQPHISFTPKEEHLGHEELRKIGISNGRPFVCFHSRSSAYLDSIAPDRDWRYHSYRDSSIKDFIPAVEELTRRGYFVARTGAVVEEPLKTTNPMIIDYAIDGRTEFLDIFLGAKCRFFLCSAVGMAEIPIVFRRPIAWVNFIPLEHVPTWSRNDLFIPKKLWLREEGRFMTFREILDSGAGRLLRTEEYEWLGIKPVENTSEEIVALAVEMDERLKDTWRTTKEDEKLQRCFWALFKPSELNQIFLSRIGADFLRQNKELLE